MFYLGIDQHRKQLTVSLWNEAGDMILRRQVSTQWPQVRGFLESIREQSEADGGYVAIVEVCGFNDWLLTELKRSGCRDVILIQAEKASRKKTDRRDAYRLGELLWINRERFLTKQKIRGVRRVVVPSDSDAEARQVVALRKRLGQQRTRTLNKIHRILLKHNLHQECPTKGIQTGLARKWLQAVPVGEVDRIELNQLLVQWALWDRQIPEVDQQIEERAARHPLARRLKSIPRMGAYTRLALASSIGDIGRFPQAGSLSNYWGLTPNCHNSADAKRPGAISKEGSATVRFLLGQMVLQILKSDPSAREWFRRVKKRRGARIAFVAVMRRLATIIWHLLEHGEEYQPGCWLQGKTSPEKQKKTRTGSTSARAQTNGRPHSTSPSRQPSDGEADATARTNGAKPARNGVPSAHRR